jgi:antitoxin component YwqK of YwqJK toxin-antitoxin module
MSQMKPLRVPLPVMILLTAMVVACGSTKETGDSYTETSNCSYTDDTYDDTYTEPYTPSYTAPTYTSGPTFPSYIAELDKSKPPEYPKTADVTLQYSWPTKPDNSTFLKDLETTYSVESYRGAANDPIYNDYYSISGTTALLVAESKTTYNADGSSTKYAHGFAFVTFDTSKRAPFANVSISTADRYLLAYGYMRDGYFYGPWWFNNVENARQGLESKVERICEYQYGKASGESRSYNLNGYLTERGYYTDGQANGTFTFWTDDGAAVQKEYVSGTAYGSYQYWGAGGALQSRSQMYGDKYYGKFEYWYPGDDWAYEVGYRDLGPDQGWHTIYDAKGKLYVQCWEEGGAWNGPYIRYAPEGHKLWEGQKVADLHHGLFRRFTADGFNDFDTEYVNGVQTGRVRWYYASGKVWDEGYYVNGKNHGRFTIYREDGTVSSVADWKDGNRDGVHIEYDILGEETLHDVYEAGAWVRSELASKWPDPVILHDEYGNEISRAYGRWQVQTQDQLPPMEVGMSMAWSAELGGCVMFGGRSGVGVSGETWLRKGGQWTRVFAEGAAPPAREYAAMAYDSRRGLIVLFGGRDQSGNLLNDTWELSPSGWSQLPVASPPVARIGGRMAYDSARGVCVLFGGAASGPTGMATVLNTTEEWNGTEWKAIEALNPPSGVFGHAMAFDEDRGVVVLQGGSTNEGSTWGTWTYDGKRWTAAPVEDWDAVYGSQHAMVYDSDARRMVLINNYGDEGSQKLTAQAPAEWWGEVGWSPILCGQGAPARQEFAAAYDRTSREVVVFGGSAPVDGKTVVYRETLVLTDETQDDRDAEIREFIASELSTPGWTWVDNAGDFNWFGSVAQDPGRGVTVMFGGSRGEMYNNETREFADGKWTLMQPKESPSARTSCITWYDETRRTVMIMGGYGPPVDGKTTSLSDLWEWNGANWKRLRESVPGMPSLVHSWTYDSKRGVLVAFATATEGEKRGLYEFNGTAWKLLEAGEPAEKLAGGYWTYDPAAEKAVYYGAYHPETYDQVGRAWYWDGKYWEEADAEKLVGGNTLYPTLYTDLARKALWQLTETGIRMLKDGQWTEWRRPRSLAMWAGKLWVDPASGRVFYYGSGMTKGWGDMVMRADTMEFDPEKGEASK